MTNEQKRFRRMAIRVYAFMTESKGVETYAEIPQKFRFTFETLTYPELIRPLIHHDRENGITLQGIAIKYGLSYQQVRTALSKKVVDF